MRYKDFLRSRLVDVVPSDFVFPSGFHLVGHVALLHLSSDMMRYASLIGEKTLEYDQRILSVAVRSGPTRDITRLPSYELVAGNNNTITIHIENGVKFRLDPLRLTFSGGNRRERMRLSKLVENDEKIVDMFSCVGQFALHIAKAANVWVTAIEINKEAYQFLLDNIKLNGLEDRVIALLGDCRVVHPKRSANRVVMGYLHNTIEYLPFALDTLVEDGGVIHMHMSIPDSKTMGVIADIEQICRKQRYSCTTKIHHVKSYSPRIGHYVFDIFASFET